MVQHLKVYFLKRYLPRWLVFIFDLTTVVIAFLVAYILRYNFDIEEVLSTLNISQIFVILPVFMFSFIIFKPYSGVLRHSTVEDIARVVFSLSISSIPLLGSTFVLRHYSVSSSLIIPYSVIIIQFALASNMLLISRFLAKEIYTEWYIPRKDVKKVMILGAGRLGQITRNALLMDSCAMTNIVGFIDTNIYLQNKRTAGIPVYSVEQAFEKIIPANKVTEIIFALEKEDNALSLKREILNLCIPKQIEIKEVPSVNDWINGELKASEIKKIKIEDLLGRDAISLDRIKIKEGVKKAVILVTGAAGSIGSEIVNQLLQFNAHQVILLDKAESDIYDLQNEMNAKYKNPNFKVIVGDVTNRVKLKKVFEEYLPTIVLNAAAYKHVPLMEEFPGEAIRVNIGGTKNLADLSIEFGVEKFVFISTDKAVNPTNVMGATKRISEIYIQSLANNRASKTQFITTRFGNVLGSNGSVVPLFRKQIERGGPVTVTHRDITRFFMTIPEACQLVLEACFMGNGGEIFVFDMGEPVKIYDLAEKMIFLSGFIPNKDIHIEITNLRPGEKLYEELLKSQENLLPTHNDKIMIGKYVEQNYLTVNNSLLNLLESVDVLENQELVSFMKFMVPEYISQNSPYCSSNKSQSRQIPKPKRKTNGVELRTY
jgi:FlaA1/EpsC-like NDP-sugar epimerase